MLLLSLSIYYYISLLFRLLSTSGTCQRWKDLLLLQSSSIFLKHTFLFLSRRRIGPRATVLAHRPSLAPATVLPSSAAPAEWDGHQRQVKPAPPTSVATGVGGGVLLRQSSSLRRIDPASQSLWNTLYPTVVLRGNFTNNMVTSEEEITSSS